MISYLFGTIGVALYAVGTALLLRRLRHGEEGSAAIAMATAVGAWLAHTLVLRDVLITPDGLQLGFFNSLSLAGWIMVLLMLLIAIRQPVQNLGIGVFPVAAITLAGAALWGGGPIISTDHLGIDGHILSSMSAYAVLGLAGVQALILLFQHRVLHDHHRLHSIRALPPLYVMETLLVRLLATGFILLTAALATGLLFLDDMFAQQMVHKTVLTILAWFFFAALLVGHRFAGWRGPIAVRLTLIGLLLLAVGYSGSKLVLELIL